MFPPDIAVARHITSIDVSAAKAAPGVIDVLTFADVDAFGAKPMPCMAPVPTRDKSPMHTTPKPILAKDKVTFTGEAIAMVIAETYAQAKDAAELVEVEYEVLDAVGTLAAAPNGPQIWDGAKNNETFDWADGDEAAVKAAFAKAAHTVSLEVVQNRVSAMPMETRNAIGVYDKAKDDYTIYVTSQGAANLRGGIARGVLNLPIEKVRVITKDVGGGFGMKGFLYPEQPMVLIAAKKVGRPVRWSAERTKFIPRRRPWPRHDHDRGACARQGRQNSGDAHHGYREHGRLSVGVCAVHSDTGGRAHIRRRLPRADTVCEHQGILFQFGAS